jgi:hypothetical protein
MRMKKLRIGVVTAALLVVAATAHANLIVNGSFEVGGFAGWTNSDPADNNHMHLVCGGGSSDGNCHLSYGPVGTLETLSQVVATNPGSMYQIEFDYQMFGGTTSELRVNWGGVTIFDLINGPGTGGYVHQVIQALAGGPSTTLQFAFRNDPSHDNFDNVIVTAVPEPGSLALLGLAAAGFGAVRRRLGRA